MALHSCAWPRADAKATGTCILPAQQVCMTCWKLCLMHAVAHVKSGAVTGLEARLALQKGREEAQRLLKLASTALQQNQQLPRSASFPPKGRQNPIGPTPHNPQVDSACCYSSCMCLAPKSRCSVAALQLFPCWTCCHVLHKRRMVLSATIPCAAQQESDLITGVSAACTWCYTLEQWPSLRFHAHLNKGLLLDFLLSSAFVATEAAAVH